MAKTKEELIEMIENELVDSTSNKITGDNVKNVMLEMVETIAENAGGGTMEYWTIPSEIVEDFIEVSAFVLLVKAQQSDTVTIASSIAAAWGGTPIAMGWDPNVKMCLEGSFMTAQEILQSLLEVSSWADFGFTQITEEEFYTV